MAVEEPAEAVGEVVEAPAAQAFFGPGHLLSGAAPGLIDEDRKTPLQEPTVEAGVVRDHQSGLFRQTGDGLVIKPLTTDVAIGDAGKAGDRLRHGPAGSSNPV
jgi:hypothetical protein